MPRILNRCNEYGLTEPLFEEFGDGFKVTLFRKVSNSFDEYEAVHRNDDNQENNVLEHSAVKADISFDLLVRIREYLREPRSRAELQSLCKISSRDYFRNKILNPLIDLKKIKLTIPDKPTSSKQRYLWNDET